MSVETLEKTFTVTHLTRLNLSNIRGLVEIHPGPEGQVQVKATKHIDTGDARNTELEIDQKADGTVSVVTRFPEGGWWLWLLGSTPCKVDYVVTLPQNAVVKVNGVSNRTSLEGLSGEFAINTVSGAVALQNLSGALKLETVSGDISAAQCAGGLNLTTVSGNVDFRHAQLSAVQAHTTSGNLDFETSLGAGPYQFNSVSGNVNLCLPAGSRCRAQISSVSGRIRGDETLLATEGVQVALHSVSGDLRLRVSDQLHPVSVPVAAPAVDRRQILEQLERGEINAAQALAGLKE